jgi:hypothetical protein
VRGGGEGVEIVTASDNDNDSGGISGVYSLFSLSLWTTSHLTDIDGQMVYSLKSSAISDCTMSLRYSGEMLSSGFDDSEVFRASDAGGRVKIFPCRDDDQRWSFEYVEPIYHFGSGEERTARGNIFSIAW